MRTSQTADLEQALRAWLASVDGDRPGATGDRFTPASPFAQARDQAADAFQSPGARAAAAANSQKAPQAASPNTGQEAATGRRATQPEPVQQAAAEAERLLTSLQRIDGGDAHSTPGRDAAHRQGGTRHALAQNLQRNYWRVGG